MEDLIKRYNNYIYYRYHDLLKSGKKPENFNNFDLAKNFEYFSSIKLTEEFKTPFYEYSDIDPEFKEQKDMSKRDTGIDLCNLKDTIVQCKLRDKSLSWGECSTFFGSNISCDENGNLKTHWKKMIITRNKECKLSDNLKEKKKLFLDRTYDKTELLEYCKQLEKPKIIKKKEIVKIRYYQKEAIDMIRKTKTNLIIHLPTGTGKNFIISHALLPHKFSYLLLVPRIILLEQIEEEILKYNPEYEKHIQKIGDGNNKYNSGKNITICVYNSVDIVNNNITDFDMIIVDEAHHIVMPEIYKIDNDDYIEENNDSEYTDEDSDDEYTDDEYTDDEYKKEMGKFHRRR
jgi:hypothetical protein